MANARKEQSSTKPQLPPATTAEQRENQLISMAFDLAEERMRAGTASAQEVTHFLKLGSMREGLERRKILQDIETSNAKVEQMRQGERQEQIAAEALQAMRRYQGETVEEEILD